MDLPVVLLVFRRPETTQRVIEALRRDKPSRVLIYADGPRSDRPDDAPAVEETRRVIEQSLDWSCDVHKDYAEQNMGLRPRVTSALTDAFTRHERAAIIEDDIVVASGCLQFFAELLERYADDHRVMQVNATNFQPHARTDESYYFSRFANPWGWATWRRAWALHDDAMTGWPELAESDRFANTMMGEPRYVEYWQKQLTRVYEGRTVSWAHRWTLSVWRQSGLSATPNVSLADNIGIGRDVHATHTLDPSLLPPRRAEPMTFPLTHPADMMLSLAADRFMMDDHYCPPPPPLKTRINNAIYQHVPGYAPLYRKLRGRS